MTKKLVLLGVGNAARALSQLVTDSKLPYSEIIGTTRGVEKLPGLEQAGITSVLIEPGNLDSLKTDAHGDGAFTERIKDADLLVSYPPDRASDEFFSSISGSCRSIVYVSSTGVYGKLSGRVDEVSPVDLETPSSVARLSAEDKWRQVGAVILRAPGLYSAHSGMISRLTSGSYRLPGDGSNYVSRIHLHDLARIVVAAFEKAQPRTTYVVGDTRPASHLEVVSWLCERLRIPIPQAIPLEQVHETLRGNRQVCADKIYKELNINLVYPTFKEGYAEAFSA